ncbi:MAG: hypothetical protein ABSE18_03260 [Minisyncoccia bacterium]|jgi:hypothetical protein
MNKKGFATLAIALIVVAILIAGGVWYYMKNISSPTQLVACTQEAKECPDGSYVGRTGPNCEFAACPGMTTTTSSIPLPTAYVNVLYNGLLHIATSNISTLGQLPPGLSLVPMEHGCVPSEPQCPQNDFYLHGQATQAGTYAFSVVFSIDGDQITQSYHIQVLPQNQESAHNTCESNFDCPAGQTCMVTGPIIAGRTIQKNCYPAGQAAPQ